MHLLLSYFLNISAVSSAPISNFCSFSGRSSVFFQIFIMQSVRSHNYFRRWRRYLTGAASGFSALAGGYVETESGRAWSAPASLPFRSPNDGLHDDTSFRRRHHVLTGGRQAEVGGLEKRALAAFYPRRERDRYAFTTEGVIG